MQILLLIVAVDLGVGLGQKFAASVCCSSTFQCQCKGSFKLKSPFPRARSSAKFD